MKTIKFLKPWTIISPYDLEDNETSHIYAKPQARCKSANSKNNRRSPIPIKIRKSLPKRIESSSHVLTPTRSSLSKSVDKAKKLTKSKSASDLTKQQRKNQLEEEKILDELNKQVSEIEDEFEAVTLRKSFPFYLEIDTDRIENEYSSPCPIQKNQPDSVIVINSPSNCKSESLSFDVLSGKIYSSRKEINLSEYAKACKRNKRKKKTIQHALNVEVVVEEETKSDKLFFWKSLAEKLTESHLKLQQKLMVRLKHLTKKTRKIENLISRRSRSLAGVSQKIEVMIQANLGRNENFLQDLIEKTAEVKNPNVSYQSQYLQSQEFLVDLVLCLWGKCLKPLTESKISVFVKIDQIFSELEGQKSSSVVDSKLFELIPLLLTTQRLEEAEIFLDKLGSEVSASSKAVMWKAFLAVLTGKNTSNLFYSLFELSPPANFSIHYKIAQIYTFFHSCLLLKTSRTVTFAKTLQLGEWEDVIIADFYSKSQDRASEEDSLKILKSLSEKSSNRFIKFLAFFRLFHVFKSYNQNSRALDLIKSAEKMNFSGDFKIIIDSFLIKTFAKMNTEVQVQSEVPLIKYQFSRLSLKYNLRASLNHLLQYLNETCAYCQVFSLSTCQFSVNFWKFILLHKLKVQKLAKKQAEKTLTFMSKDHLKKNAIQEILKSFKSLENLIELLSSLASQKDVTGLVKVSASLEKLDDFLAAAVKTIAKRTIFDKEKIPMHKFEGLFALWSVFYRNSKIKEKQFKSLEGQEEIDRRDSKHPLYILDVKVNRKSREIGKNFYG